MKPVLERSRPKHSVVDADRNKLLARLTAFFAQKKVQGAYLVGSYARETASPWSDLDLIVIVETHLPFPERPLLFEELNSIGLPIDLLVYTPEEFARMEENPTGFWRATQKDRVRLV